MAYISTGKLPAENASKLGHLPVIQSQWVQTLIEDFEDMQPRGESYDVSLWGNIDISKYEKLKYIWAVDGSFAPVKTNPPTGKEVAFVKTALISIDQKKLSKIDKQNPHPLLLQDIMSGSALFHATVFPMKNVKTSLGSNYDAIRHIVYDSMMVDENGQYFKTLKWLLYQKWGDSKPTSPNFDCPHCSREIPGLPYDTAKDKCPKCKNEVLLTDVIGFHHDMEEESASERIASSYMLIMEHLMLLTIVRLLWHHADKSVFSDTLFIKDGPLTLRSQYAKLVPLIREFLEHTKRLKRPIHIIGQEKSGVFHEHLSNLAKYVAPKTLEESPALAVLTHDYDRREVYRTGDLVNPYGERTNWGEKVFVKLEPNTALVLDIPTGYYCEAPQFPKKNDIIGLDRIIATLPELISRKYEGALFPIELANGVASMSSYPSSRILQRFIEDI
jgi:hypothetical protein